MDYTPAPNNLPSTAPPDLPSAFVMDGGEGYAWAASYGYSGGAGVASGIGAGFGDSEKSVGVELSAWGNLESNGESGLAVDVKLGRFIKKTNYYWVGVGAGTLNISAHGSADKNTGVYGVGSLGTVLNKNTVLSANLGYGNGDEKVNGLFASIALVVNNRISVYTGWEGNEFKAGISLVPVSNLPLKIDVNWREDGSAAIVVSSTKNFRF